MEKIQSIIENIGKNCCLIHCYIYCAGIAPDTKEYFRITYDAIKAGVEVSGIENDCFVANPRLFLQWLTGKRYNIYKKVIGTISQIKAPTPVRYMAEGYTPHFVVVENGEIVFDGLENSKSVKLGRPIDARIIELDIGV